MPSTNGFHGADLARLQARVAWLMHRLETLDARLVALELRAARAGKRPQSRVVRPAVKKSSQPVGSSSTAATSRRVRRR